ncbi:MAG TPA: MMPL family transporter [Chitinophagaceae bacterium]|nr:MMPL family transporter [Chitinophagaceae bacterium]
MIWQRLAGIVLKFRLALIIGLLGLTAWMGYYARQVKLSYDFVKAIPVNDPQFKVYQVFRKQFGEDGNLLVIGVKTDHFFDKGFFAAYYQMTAAISKIPAVQDVLSVPTSIDLVKNKATHRLEAVRIFHGPLISDSEKHVFLSLPFYQGILYNPDSGAFLMAVRINKNILNSAARTQVIDQIISQTDIFKRSQGVQVYLSGLPLIRTIMSDKIARELKLFLLFSLILTAAILYFFFRSLGTVLISMAVVGMGVIWSMATIVLLGYKITLLTGLIPPLIVVIGIPNCVYFLNKYHSEFARHGNKIKSLVRMIDRMGIVTLFTNITAAIGFGVFYFTQSAILKEFGEVAGLNIMMIFVISFIFLPAILSYMPAPKLKHTNYLESRIMLGILKGIEKLVFRHRGWIYICTILLIAGAVAGIARLNNVAFIVDDIPHSDKIYGDLKFFEKNFGGVMPLEILVDTKKKYGIFNLKTLRKLDTLSSIIASEPQFGKPLSIAEGVKFAMQAYYGGDSGEYHIPNEYDLPFLAPYIEEKAGGEGKQSNLSKLLSSFMDSSRRIARVSVNMKDVGSKELPVLLSSLKHKADRLFNRSTYHITFTGTSIIFLEGSRFIINGLKNSILLAILLIICCMLYLFRSWKMLIIALIPNLIPLAITAGVMGWTGVHLKPSTVLVFSVALGITIDVTIRFLVNFKQELPRQQYNISATVKQTIHDTGLSILYTGLILFAGFMIFSFSGFEGTKALGWLTSLTLVIAMISNLTLLPALLLWMERHLFRKALEEPLWTVMDEPEDIDLDKLGLSGLNDDPGKTTD